MLSSLLTPGLIVFLEDAPSFNQLPLPMRITFTVVAIGTMYAVWVFVFRDLVRQATRLDARDRDRLRSLAEAHDLGAAISEPVTLDRLNIADVDESERAYSAVQLFERGLALTSLHHQGWQSEMAALYADLEATRSYAERQLTGFRAAILGPLAYLVQKKRYYLGLLVKNRDGLTQTILLQGSQRITESLGDSIRLAQAAAKPPITSSEKALSSAG
ncbi:MAG: hypothetical protein CFK52_11770 [Chloracidobacterium sp. CP2_5A]|nr:MAG: hypothetical protein CFK52_11770 [Chloracidobacterium sp. CP2_5A]